MASMNVACKIIRMKLGIFQGKKIAGPWWGTGNNHNLSGRPDRLSM
jgi:hypothetical protein